MTGNFGHDPDRFSEMIERVAAEIRQPQQPHSKARGVAQSTWDACLWSASTAKSASTTCG
jgi:hypothetical protein